MFGWASVASHPGFNDEAGWGAYHIAEDRPAQASFLLHKSRPNPLRTLAGCPSGKKHPEVRYLIILFNPFGTMVGHFYSSTPPVLADGAVLGEPNTIIMPSELGENLCVLR